MPQSLDGSPANFTETAGTLTNTTVSVSANARRKGLIISNNSDTVMTYRVGGTATANVGISIPAGQAITLSGVTNTAASGTLFCAGTSKAYTIYEFSI